MLVYQRVQQFNNSDCCVVRQCRHPRLPWVMAQWYLQISSKWMFITPTIAFHRFWSIHQKILPFIYRRFRKKNQVGGIPTPRKIWVRFPTEWKVIKIPWFQSPPTRDSWWFDPLKIATWKFPTDGAPKTSQIMAAICNFVLLSSKAVEFANVRVTDECPGVFSSCHHHVMAAHHPILKCPSFTLW